MSSFPVYNQSGQEVGSYELDPADLAPEINRQLLHDVVVMYQSNQRQGSHRSKTRSMVSGNKKKMYRQKGTGNARAGGKRSPIRRGGGHAHARDNVDYSYRLPRKAVRLATRMAVRSKFDDDQVTILDELTLSEVGTKNIAAMLKSLGLSDRSCLLSIAQHDPLVWLSSRNIPTVRVAPAAELNAYNVLRQRQLVITREALDVLRAPAVVVE